MSTTHLINTPIISTTEDHYWEKPLDSSWAKPNETLIISNFFSKGGDEEALLYKMFMACKVAPEQMTIYLYQADTNPISWSWLSENIMPKKVFLFGIHPSVLRIAAQFYPNQINQFDQANFILTNSLGEINANTALKQALWTQVLKPLYL